MNVITDDLAQRHRVRVMSSECGEARTATERRVKLRFGVIDSLRIGDFVLHNVPVAVMKARDLNMGIPFLKIPGIIGWPVIARFRTTFDYPGRRLVLETLSVAQSETRNLFFIGMPVVEVMVDESGPLNFLFDTGAIGSLLTEAGFAKLTPTPALSSAVGCIGGAGGGDARSLKILRNIALTLDQQTISPLNLHLHKLPIEGLPITIDGLLGEDVLRRFVVTVDARQGTLTLVR